MRDPEMEFMNVIFSRGFWAKTWAFWDATRESFPVFNLIFPLYMPIMNSMEQKTRVFVCYIDVQEFHLFNVVQSVAMVQYYWFVLWKRKNILAFSNTNTFTRFE